MAVGGVEADRHAQLALITIAVATAIRLVVVAIVPAGIDEAYTIGIARQFSLSYFDHPPLHLWLTGLMELFGDSLLLLRLPFVLLGALSGWLMFLLARDLFGPAAGLWSLLIFTFAPVFGLGHAMLILPDGPLIAAGLGTSLIVARIVMGGDKAGRRIAQWLLAGVCAGLAILSKYHGVLLVLGLFLFLLTTREGRRWLATPGPWLAAAVAALGMVPALVWNAQNGWVSFAFQAGRGSGGSSLRPLGPLISLATQFLYLLPWVAVPLLIVLVRAAISGPANLRRWLPFCLAILPIWLFTGLTLVSSGLAHWPMPGWLFAIPLLGEAIANAGKITRRVAAVTAAATAAVIAGFIAIGTPQARWGTFDGPILAVLGSDPTEVLVPWDELPILLADHGFALDEQTMVVAQNWARSGLINATLGGRVPVVCLCNDQRHFRFLNPPERFAGWTAVVIGDERFVTEARLDNDFSELGPVTKIAVTRGGREVLPLWVRRGTGFRPDGM